MTGEAGVAPVEPDLSTDRGWDELGRLKPSRRPKQLTASERDRQDAFERVQYDDARLDHISRIDFKTPAYVECLEKIQCRVLANRRLKVGVPRPSILIDGSCGGIGKSTVLRAAALWWLRAQRQQYPAERTSAGHPFRPLVALTLPGDVTLKDFNRILAHFMNHPWSSRWSRNEAALPLQQSLLAGATSLFVIDEVHFINLKHQDKQLVLRHIKDIWNRVPVTFLFAGVDCERHGFLREGLGLTERERSQVASRVTRLEVKPFDAKSDAAAWTRLLRAIEQEAILLDAPPHMLSNPKMRRYLYDRSKGQMAPLMTLIRDGMQEAIEKEIEALTEGLFDKIDLSDKIEREAAGSRIRQRHHDARADRGAADGRTGDADAADGKRRAA